MMDGQQLAAGWYPDPDDPTARRYWDGQAWSAPLPVEPAQADPVHLAPKADWEVRAEERGTAVTAAGRSQLVCPHCQVRGRVTSKQVKMKKGVSGGKLTGAVLTAGISMLGTGLSRKEKVTEMRCGNCKTVWHV